MPALAELLLHRPAQEQHRAQQPVIQPPPDIGIGRSRSTPTSPERFAHDTYSNQPIATPSHPPALALSEAVPTNSSLGRGIRFIDRLAVPASPFALRYGGSYINVDVIIFPSAKPQNSTDHVQSASRPKDSS